MLLTGKLQLAQADFVAAQEKEGAVGGRLAVDGMTLEQVERHMIEKAMEQHLGNISKVARALGLSRNALYRRLERHGLAAGEQDSEL
jgi:two-component system NtrC family response regulator